MLRSNIIFFNSLFCAILLTWLFYYLSPKVFGAIGRLFKKSPTRPTATWPKLNNYRSSAGKLYLGWSGLAPHLNKLLIGAGLATAGALFWLRPLSILTTIFSLTPFLFVMILILYRGQNQKKRFLKDLPEALDAITKALQTGYTIPQAFELVAKEAHAPLKDVLKAVNRGAALNLALEKTLTAINDQLNVPEWELFHQALLTHQKIGGNLIPVLANLASTIRQNIVIKQEVNAATAAGRISAVIIAATTPALFIFFFVFNPSHLGLMLKSDIGQKLLMLAAILQVSGYIIMRRIATVKY